MKKKRLIILLVVLTVLVAIFIPTVLATTSPNYAYSSGENAERILISSADGAMGSVSPDAGDGNLDTPGETWTFTANAASGFKFDHWETSGSSLVNETKSGSQLSVSFKDYISAEQQYKAVAVFAKEDEITITFDFGDNSSQEDVVQTYKAGDAITAPVPDASLIKDASFVSWDPAVPATASADLNGAVFSAVYEAAPQAAPQKAGMQALAATKTYSHIDIRIAGQLTIDYKINGVSQPGYPKTLNVTTSNASATYTVNGETKAVPNFEKFGYEWRSSFTLTLPEKVSITATLTDQNGKTYPFSHTYTGSAITAANDACDDHSGFDFDLAASQLENIITHDVTFKAGDNGKINGGTADIAHTGIVDGSNFPAAPSATPNPGYAFAGWSPSLPDKVTADGTYTAQWTKITQTFHVKNNNGPGDTGEGGDHGYMNVTYNGATVKVEAGETADFTYVDGVNDVQVDFIADTGWEFDYYVENPPTKDYDNPEHFDPRNYIGQGNETIGLQPKWKHAEYTVTFIDHDNAVLKTQTVQHGQAATAPTDPTRTGYTFTGWDKAFHNVTSNLTVKALYTIKTYTITFVDHNDAVLKTQTVDHGGAATAPANPTRTGYTFTGWDKAFNNVTSNLTVKALYTIKTYTVTFVDYNDAVLKTQTVNHGAAATAPTDPTRTGFTFTGWDKAFNNITSDLTVKAMYETSVYTVTFVDYNDVVLKTQSVNHGAAATAPANPTRTGYTFMGWDKAFNNVTSNLTVQAQYTINTYTVTFIDYNDVVLKTQTVDHGAAATAPANPTRTGFTFTDWDKAFDNITSDLTVKAQYATNAYTVTFVDYNDTVLKIQGVEHGNSATAPTDPTRTGYTFTGWDKAFDNITSDLTVKALYSLNTYTVTFVDFNDAVLKTQTVNHGAAATAPANPARTGYTFINWDKAFDNVTSDLTVKALYTINKFTVTFVDHNDTVLKTQSVDYGTAATAPVNPTRTGYAFTGWDKAFNNITSDLTVKALYAINNYTVNFVDYNDTLLKTSVVSYGGNAVAPANPSRTGYTFTGWDKPYTNVTADLTVKAQYAINTYTVNFVDYNGTALGTSTVSYGSPATAPANPVREGYMFTGWDRDFTNVTSNMTVTAQYIIRTYDVLFVDYDGTLISEQTVSHGGNAIAPANPSRAGHAFTGWDKAFTNVTSNLAVIAQYQINTYRVQFFAADGVTQIGTTQTVTWNTSARFETAPARAGYAFDRWTLTGDNNAERTSLVYVRENIRAVASYVQNGYTVTFVDYDGNVIGTDGVLPGEAATAPDEPQRDGYTFAGWDVPFDSVTSNLTVTAQYEAVPGFKLDIKIIGDGDIEQIGKEYTQGDIINLMEIGTMPGEGSVFIEWQDADGNRITNVTMDSDKEVFVVFRELASLDEEAIPEAAGSTTPPCVDCGWLWLLLLIPAGLLIWWLLWLWFAVVPVAEQVVSNPDGTYTIQWGYKNRKLRRYRIDEDDSRLSLMTGEILGVNQNPPSDFLKGEHNNVFTSTVASGTILQWKIKNRKEKVDLSKYKR